MVFIDCESAGLRGETFAFCMVDLSGKTIFNGFYRHDSLTTNHWLAENVEPNLSGNEYKSRREFLEAAANAWINNKGEAVAHMGIPVESNFFQLLWSEGLMGEFEGPYPLHDTASLLKIAGEDPTSEKSYAKKHGIIPKNYKEHSAESDAHLTRLVWISLS